MSKDKFPNVSESTTERREFNNSKRGERVKNFKLGGSLLSIVFFACLAVTVMGVLRGSNNSMSFEYMLSVLGDTYTIPVDWIYSMQSVTLPEWGFFIGDLWVNFNWLKAPFNVVLPIIELLLFLVTGLSQAVLFLLSFVRILYGV